MGGKDEREGWEGKDGRGRMGGNEGRRWEEGAVGSGRMGEGWEGRMREGWEGKMREKGGTGMRVIAFHDFMATEGFDKVA